MRISDWSSDVCSSDLTPEQLVLVVADHVAAERAEVAIADEPAIDAVDALHDWHLVLHARRRERREHVRRLGEMRVAVDDLDAIQPRIEALGGRRGIHFAQPTARRIAFGRPVFADRKSTRLN